MFGNENPFDLPLPVRLYKANNETNKEQRQARGSYDIGALTFILSHSAICQAQSSLLSERDRIRPSILIRRTSLHFLKLSTVIGKLLFTTWSTDTTELVPASLFAVDAAMADHGRGTEMRMVSLGVNNRILPPARFAQKFMPQDDRIARTGGPYQDRKLRFPEFLKVFGEEKKKIEEGVWKVSLALITNH